MEPPQNIETAQSNQTGNEEYVAKISSAVVPVIDKGIGKIVKVSNNKKIGILNLLINLLFTWIIIFSYAVLERYIDYGGPENQVKFWLFMGVSGFAVVFFLHFKKFSHTIWIPVVVSAFHIWPTIKLYNSFKNWISYQSSMMQSAFSGDSTLLILFIALYIAIPVIIVFHLLNKSQPTSHHNNREFRHHPMVR
ncbi:hypothetical protein [Evansella tamaricis]|uniref:Uncharacterized protein n=1 Tax=Evansella tamaricis TaxID=2069301 RepID=A0ABS6JK59_9BACI|nr:hypothetical protein [Evansella tamaricis]MBU9712703.1 hypothetical protein [Evansella tamaricis]